MARRSIGFVIYRPYYPINPMHFTSLEAAARRWEDGPGVAELREVVQLRKKDYDRAVKARNKENS